MKFQPGQIFRNTQRHVDVDRFSTDRPIRQFIKEEILQVEEVIEELKQEEDEQLQRNEVEPTEVFIRGRKSGKLG
jgi:hypothetical protein